jgi:uncharacterized protein
MTVRRPLHHPLALLLGACLAVAASAVVAVPQVPALNSPASDEHHVGKVTFCELVTPDLAAAERFYGGLFGWTFSGTGDYAQASLGGQAVAGVVQRPFPAGQKRQPAWLTFFSVRDVDSAQKAAADHGAKVLLKPRAVPDRGREAVLADPQGAVFAVVASSSGDAPDYLAAPGQWIWSSLITTDPDTAAAFYQTLFDYEIFDVSSDASEQHLMLASDNYARASANTLPANGSRGGHPHWLNYVRVDDAVQTAAKVVSLGGRVLVEPRVDRHGGRIAVVADPQGAAFGLLEWTDTQTKEVSQ